MLTVKSDCTREFLRFLVSDQIFNVRIFWLTITKEKNINLQRKQNCSPTSHVESNEMTRVAIYMCSFRLTFKRKSNTIIPWTVFFFYAVQQTNATHLIRKRAEN